MSTDLHTVLLHGLGGSPAAWNRVLPLLSGTVRVPQLGGAASIEAEADRIAAHLCAPAVVAGHSMGGLVATALAERHPALVRRLVLVNTPPTRASRISARGFGERILGVPLIGNIAWRAMPDALLAKGLRTAFTPGMPVPEEFVADLRATGLAAFLASSRAIDSYLGAQTLADRLAALAQPVHFIYGARDQRVDPAAFATLGEVCGIKVTALAEVGHTPTWDQPEAVAAAIFQPSAGLRRGQ